MTRVKICGITNAADGLRAAELGAAYLGLNFYPPSPRVIDVAVAETIAEAARKRFPGIALVGIFVDRPVAEIAALDAALAFDLVQFHGTEPVADLARFAGRALEVFHVRETFDPAPIVAREGEAGEIIWGYLIDYQDPARHGGSGRSWHFETLRALPPAVADRPLFIAGGLGPANVAAAIEAARPWGVDVCSGVESAPGIKDPELLRQLFEEIEHV